MIADSSSPVAVSTIPPETDALRRDGADARCEARRDGAVVASASLWWRGLPPWPDATLGYIGHYTAADAPAGAALLEHACRELANAGATLAVGPIDGNTWRTYRLVVERGDEPPFFLEPRNPDDWPAHFTSAGFDVFARYTSAVAERGDHTATAAATARARAEAAGYQLRALDVDAAARDLDAFYDVSAAAFAGNLLYSPIPREAFLAQYTPLLPKIDPRMVILAERDGAVVGYVFAFPDFAELARTGAITSAILKTLAVHPDHAGHGLGGALTALCQATAFDLGFARVIHALMLESNVSQRISRHSGRTFRRYALFARRLA